ncbi:HNH endonuclease [Roseateles puraquae]|uniref:HNH endonuclease n=2 Tax=Pseudomonadota TaxID=1224 RepID=A0A254N382_9BURK|nr:HNH endonuclease [Roseateles puraquae]MDG0853055.1 HNH endonuclease [Roseateles puraquae]OWR02174.1 HNH endonuclease [Roseateles puraquae]
MAATQGHGNPNWTRDETILALNLYLSVGGQVPGPDDPKVIALSERLRALPVHREAVKRDTFRNPAGVAFKLQNIRQVATGSGLGNVSAMDRSTWEEFGGSPLLVQRMANAIADQVASGEAVEAEITAVADDEEFAEGRVLTALHRRRERVPKLRGLLITKRRAEGRLTCECCGAGPWSGHPEMALAGFEAHHVTPLAEYKPGAVTRLRDLALLCATCHRLIHRAINVERRWVFPAQLSEMLGMPS